jgi:disulfide bond formation protein DsbB
MSDITKTHARPRHLLIVCCIFSLIVLALSYSAEYLFKMRPCKLCTLQRIPYFFLALLPSLTFLNFKYTFLRKAIIYFFMSSAILAFYHLMVIKGFAKDFCGVQGKRQTIDDFMSMLESHVPCSKAEWKVLGLPAAIYNFCFSLAFIVLFILKKRERRGLPSSN